MTSLSDTLKDIARAGAGMPPEREMVPMETTISIHQQKSKPGDADEVLQTVEAALRAAGYEFDSKWTHGINIMAKDDGHYTGYTIKVTGRVE